MKNIDKIYRIGNLIAAQASDDIPGALENRVRRFVGPTHLGIVLCYYIPFVLNAPNAGQIRNG